MRRSRKPLSVVRRIEGSNPSPSAFWLNHAASLALDAANRQSMEVRESPLFWVLTGERLANGTVRRGGVWPTRRPLAVGDRREPGSGVRALEVCVEERRSLVRVPR